MKTIYLSYSRVSTKEQAMQGASIEAQIAEHKRYAIEHGFNIDTFYCDDGFSASGFKRPDLQKMLARIAQNRPDHGVYLYRYVIIVRYQNRLIRSIAKKRSLQCVFKKYNVEVLCLNGKWEGSPIDGGLATDIQMIFDENEITQISPRVIASYQQIAKEGCYPLGGRPPIGYKREKVGRSSKLVPDEDVRDFIIELFETLALNKYTVVEVVEYLRIQKVMGRCWSVNMLHKIIDNPLYYGRFQTKWFDSDDPELKCDRSGWFSETLHTEPLISKDLFLKVQNAVHYKKHKEYHTYLFKGKVKCKLCGEWMSLRSSYKKNSKGIPVLYQYYYCKHCDRRLNQNYILDEIIWRYPTFERKILNPHEIERMKNKLKAKQQRNKILDRFFDESVIDEQDYINEVKTIKQEISKLKKEITDVQKKKNRDFNKMSENLKKRIFNESIEEIQVIPGSIYKDGEVLKVIFKDTSIKIPKAKK